MADYTQAQFDRLPKWAQALIRKADQRVAYGERLTEEATEFEVRLRADMAQSVLDGPGDVDAYDWRGPVVAVRDPYDDGIPVAREQDVIRFYYDPENRRHWVDVSARRGSVQIMADSGLSIRARSSNTFDVQTED